MRIWWLIMLLGCGTSSPTPPDANTHTPAITPQLCTSGTPGDPTCPLTHVDLGSGQLQFYLQPDPMDPALFYVLGPQLTAGAAGLYISHPSFEAWPEGTAAPMPNPTDPN